MRNVILHMHLPKTGGTTFSAVLRREFGAACTSLSFLRRKTPDRASVEWNGLDGMDGSELVPCWRFGPKDIFGLLDGDTGTRAVARHGMFIGPEHLGGTGRYRLFPVFFVRNYLAWHMSFYFQQRRDPELLISLSTDPRVIVAKTGNIREYTEFCADHCEEYHKMTVGWPPGTERDVMRNLGMYRIGVTERYNESLAVMECELAAHFPGLDLSYAAPDNVDGARAGRSVRQNLDDLEERVGTDLLCRLAGAHRDCTDLYERVNMELDARVSRIDGFGDRLADFERRCGERARRAGG